jgi:dihydrofolate synthase/folylpolyglutamate synthase
MPSNRRWIESLSPWPAEFGLGRTRELLAALGEPQREFPAIHVVGTNGKTTTARLLEALLETEGLKVGTYTSPHVVDWDERIRVAGRSADFEEVVARVRVAAERVGATQFEALTAAAFAEFAAQEVDVAVVEAGLGGRLDATNVLEAALVVLTNVALDHTEVLGETREEIAAEKLAVTAPGATVILGEGEWRAVADDRGAATVVVAGQSNLGLALAAAETFLGRRVDAHAAEGVRLPGRLEHVGDSPLEIWDGAHNLAGVGWLLARLPSRRYVVVASILREKAVDGMLAALAAVGDRLVATESSNPRAIPAEELAARGARFFTAAEAEADPEAAVVGARRLAGEKGAVLVCGSLYLLLDLAAVRPTAVPWESSASG